MTWLVWRQHRAEGLILLVVLAVIGVFLLMTGPEMAWDNPYNGFLWDAPVLGALVGAPLVTRKVEQRTHLLIWTQSMTRMRWLMVKLVLVLGAGLLASGTLLAVLTWWNSPLVQIFGSFGTRVYDTSGPVWVATTGLSLARGIFAGALTRRTVAAIFLTMVLFVAIRVPVEFLWRPHFETPVTVTYAIDQPNPPALSNQDWVVSQGFIDAQGNRSTDFRGNCTSGETSAQCLHDNGVQGDAEITVQGEWILQIKVLGPAGAFQTAMARMDTAPSAIPLWLGWLIGGIPLYGLLAFFLILGPSRKARA